MFRNLIRNAGLRVRNGIQMYRSMKKFIKEAELPSLSGGSDPDARHSDFSYYRQLGSLGNMSIVPDVTIERAIKICRYLHMTNGIARRTNQICTDYVLGLGMEPKVKEKENEELVDFVNEYWFGYGNAFHLNQFDILSDLLRDGNLLAVSHISAAGQTAWSYADPLNIKEIIPESMTDGGGRIDRPGIIILKDGKEIQDVDGTKRKELKVIRAQTWNPKGEDFGRLIGDCFFFPLNRIVASPFGLPENFTVVDWIVHFDFFLTQLVEGTSMMNSFVWDLMFKNLTQEQIDAKMKDFPKEFRPGMIWGHNQDVELKPAGKDWGDMPAIHQYEKIILGHILGSLGYPRHWFASPEDSTRATAAESGDPTYKKLESRQRYYKQLMMMMLDYAIDQAILYGTLTPPEELTRNQIEFSAPAIDVKDATRLGATISQIASGLAMAVDNKWITNDSAAACFANVVQPFGIDVTPMSEEERDEIEAEERLMPQQTQQPPWLQAQQQGQPTMGAEAKKAEAELMQSYRRWLNRYERLIEGVIRG